MLYINLAKYRRFAEAVEAGAYTVSPGAGLIFGPKGVPLSSRTRGGYCVASFKWGGRREWVMVHRAVWEYVFGPIEPGLEVNHINGDKTDNRLVNLECVTPSANKRHAIQSGLMPPKPRGEDNPGAKLTEQQVVAIFDRMWAGESAPSVAERFGIARTLTRLIYAGKAWPHVTQPLLKERGLNPTKRRVVVNADRATGERSGRAKLTDPQYAEILKRAASGESSSSIAKDFPAVTSSAIRQYIKRHGGRQSWSAHDAASPSSSRPPTTAATGVMRSAAESCSTSPTLPA